MLSHPDIDSLIAKAKELQAAKLRAGKTISLDDALHLIATAAGFATWDALKSCVEATSHFCPQGTGVHTKIWYSSYNEALQHQRRYGGYLLPYYKNYFICDLLYIEFLGVPRTDPDLKRIGANWNEPADADAFARIVAKIKATPRVSVSQP